MSRLSRLVALGLVAGVATLAVPQAQASPPDCIREPCYQCVMYPCYPGDWVHFLRDTALRAVCDTAGC